MYLIRYRVDIIKTVKTIIRVVVGFFLISIASAFFPIVALAGPPDAANSTLVSTDTIADGRTASNVTVTLKDSGGVALVGIL
jgi:hypothetical protein